MLFYAPERLHSFDPNFFTSDKRVQKSIKGSAVMKTYRNRNSPKPGGEMGGGGRGGGGKWKSTQTFMLF
jgi:hypothetical protein